MAEPEYSMGFDDAGVVHLQAAFEPRSDLNFKWRTGFIMFRVRESGETRWGVWNQTDVLMSLPLQDAMPFLEALIAKAHYFADTLLPRSIPLDEGGYIAIFPPEHSHRVNLDDSDLAILHKQLEQCRTLLDRAAWRSRREDVG